MKNLFKISIMSYLLLCFFICNSCTSELANSDSAKIVKCDADGNYIFDATLNDFMSTRTIRQEDGSVYWDKDESIKIFYDSQTYGVFTSKNQEVSASVTFGGKFNSPVSDSDITSNGVIALYPSQDAEYNDGKVVFTLPSQQEAEVGTFKKGMFPSLAQSKSSSLSFYNICGGIKLSVNNGDVRSITLRGNNSEYLAGRISVSFTQSGIPDYSIVDGETEITLTAPQGGCFEVGKIYYIVALPCTLLNGFTMVYHTDNETATTKINNTVTIHRSKFGLVLGKDVRVVNFTCPYFKASVVGQYDDNWDGEIDYVEAENVTNINCSNMGVTSLDGIKHFTNLRSLNCSHNSIKEIDLSENSGLATLNCSNNPLEKLCVDNCTSLTALSIVNATTQSISQNMVNIDGYNGVDKFAFSAVGTRFTDFSFVNSSTVKALEIAGDFTKSLNIYNVPGLSELQVGDINVEVMDLHNLNLSSIDLTRNTNLKELYLNDNKLTSINLSKCTQLVKLNLSDNQLQSINIRMNTLLTELKINNNSSISTLNIDNNTVLKVLEAEGLSISTLDMSQHSSLKDVKLRNNPQLRSMIIWTAATKKNDYLLFDMANVMVTDANGTSYGYPYSVGQYIPWFNGGVVYSINANGGGMMVNLKDLRPTYYDKSSGKYWDDSAFYFYDRIGDPDIPSMFYDNSETDGVQNMKDVYDYYGDYDKFAAYVTAAGISKDGKWYLPSLEELKDMLSDETQAVNATLFKNKCNRLDQLYFSSSINASGGVYAVTMVVAGTVQSKPSVYTYRRDGVSVSNLRAIRKF